MEHTADIRLFMESPTLEALFSEALQGLTDILKPTVIKSSVPAKRIVKIESADKTALLIDFLNEILALSQINKKTYFDPVFTRLSDTHLEAEIKEVETEGFGEDIKAVTYHEAEIKKGETGFWQTNLVFDI